MLYLRTLGGLSLDGGGSATLVAGQKARLALLAVLALGGQSGVNREKLLALFWPDSDVDHARGALKQALYALRRHLGDNVIVGNGELRLNPGVIGTDVGDFAGALAAGDLEAVVARYTGPFLDGVFLRSSAEFEQWADRERVRIAHTFCETLQRLACAADERDDYSNALAWWRRAASENPLDNRIAVSLVRSLAQGGDTAGALRQAAIYRAIASREVGDHADPTMDAAVAAVQSGSLCSIADTRSNVVSSRTSTISRETDGESSPEAADNSAVPTRALLEPPVHVTSSRPFVRRWFLLGVALSGLVGIVGLGAWQERRALSVEDTVSVVAACEPPVSASARQSSTAPQGELGELVRDRVVSGLTDLHSVKVVRQARTRFLVVARCRNLADSMVFSADIIDRNADRILTTIGPASAPVGQPGGGVELLRDRVMTAIALRVDPKLKAWVYASNAPSNYESYRELRLGIDAFVAMQLAEATLHFGKAAALDRASPTPLVWAAFARAYYWDTAADSILAELDASHRRMGPWDDAMVALVKAFMRGDLPLAHRAAHAVAAAAPNSEWRVLVASTAMSENRAREAQRVLRAVDPAAGWINGWEFYWVTLDQSHHLLGDFRDELGDDRRALKHWPNNGLLIGLEFKALPALGWIDELERRWDEVSSVRERNPAFGWLVTGSRRITCARGYRCGATVL